ncbi:hypothetical protein SK128_024779 [Halocaridina rubra]|uniref:Uncharacterized protein n=1 Tax=Halocaridina rubra TaxID=373956 RepID=A0AAN8X1N2_HALRR
MEKGSARKLVKASKNKMDGEHFALHWMDHKNIFSQAIKGLRGKDTFTDATLACDGHFYPVHKFVLSTCSEYLGNIFDWTPCVNPVIVINNVTSAELEVLMDFMYNGEVNVKEDMISGVLQAAQCMKIRGLCVVDDERQKTPVGGKNSLSASHSEPPKKKPKHDIKKKVSCHSNPSPTSPTFRAPQPPSRAFARPATPTLSAHLPTTSRPQPSSRVVAVTTTSRSLTTSRPPAVVRASYSQPPSPVPNSTSPAITPTTATIHSSPVPAIAHLTPSSPAVTQRTIPCSSPTLVSPVHHYASRGPTQSPANVVATSTPLYTSGEIVTPVLNLSIPSTVCHAGSAVQAHTIELQPTSFDFQNQVSYPQIISSQAQTFTGQTLGQVVHEGQVIQANASCENGQTIHILSPNQQHVTQVPKDQLSTQVNGTQYELHATKQTLVSLQQAQAEREALGASNPSKETVIIPPEVSGEVSDLYKHQNRTPEEMIKHENSDAQERTVVVRVSIADDTESSQLSIPHTLTPMDTLVEAVKMEEQNIVIKTDDGSVGIPDFLDSLEMRPMYEAKEEQERIVEMSQNSATEENFYEFNEVYPHTSTSSISSVASQRNQKISLSSSAAASSSSLVTRAPSASSRGSNGEAKAHVCRICHKQFSKKDGLRRHEKIHNKPPASFSCTNCSFTAGSLKELSLHKQLHLETLECQMCEFTTKVPKEMVDHKRTHAEPFACLLCDFTSRSAREFGEHKKTHPPPYICSQCDYQSPRMDCLGRHIMRVHENGGPHRCQYCDHSFITKANLSRHVKATHGNKQSKDG